MNTKTRWKFQKAHEIVSEMDLRPIGNLSNALAHDNKEYAQRNINRIREMLNQVEQEINK